MSNIRVSVEWKNSAAFAGEVVECRITFKNISTPSSIKNSTSAGTQIRTQNSAKERWKDNSPAQTAHTTPESGGHQKSSTMHTIENWTKASFNNPSNPDQVIKGPRLEPAPNNRQYAAKYRQRRSVSIVSISGELKSSDLNHHGQHSFPKQLRGNHSRAASLHVLPRRTDGLKDGSLATSAQDHTGTMPSPFLRSSTYSAADGKRRIPTHFRRDQESFFNKSPLPVDNRREDSNLSLARTHSNSLSSPTHGIPSQKLDTRSSNPNNIYMQTPSPKFGFINNGPDNLSPMSRVLSPPSTEGTPRSSGDFYSMSNNSSDTLASDYVNQDLGQMIGRSGNTRYPSSLVQLKPDKSPEILMIGYGHVSGSFVFDGSLVNQSPFHEVKRKGIIGGQGGGGVIRAEPAKRDSGLFGSLGWGNIGESLGGFLGSHEMSSISHAKGANSKQSIPIVSTPQSLLFVDLHLEPGQSRSYSYGHRLPRGIPPTYRGRAIRISYNLVIGVQKAAQLTPQPQLQQFEIPFRVLPSVDGNGEIVGHDLMSPHIMLHGAVSSTAVNETVRPDGSSTRNSSQGKTHISHQDFLLYVNKLLNDQSQDLNQGLVSPSDMKTLSSTLLAPENPPMKELIDLAILRCNSTTSTKMSPNRFEITRSGNRIAVLFLARPAYRLGETVSVAVDFQKSDVRCYSCHATLETSEVINPVIALRSKASVYRISRRIHASQSSSTVSAQRILFSPNIPINGTPEFVTSGVSLEWKLRFEFATANPARDEGETSTCFKHLLEEVSQDERGSILAATQAMSCDTFDISVPLKVYGAVNGFDDKRKAEDFLI